MTADALKSGGIFVLGLDLAVYGEELPDEESWRTRVGGRTVNHVMLTIPATALVSAGIYWVIMRIFPM